MEFGVASTLLGFLFVVITVKGFVDAETGMMAQPQFEIIRYAVSRGETLVVLFSPYERRR